MKKVALLTTFDQIQHAYSLNIVVQMQLKMLLMNGYSPVFIASKGFRKSVEHHTKLGTHTSYADPRVTILEYTPVKKGNSVTDYKDNDEFMRESEQLASELEVMLKDVDVVITHDLIYQADAVKHNLAARMVAKKLPKIHWLHEVHSATPPALLNEILHREDTPYSSLVKQPFPHATIIYPNAYDLPRVAKVFGVSENNVRAVNHPIDMTQFFDPKLEELLFKKEILNADVICFYPLRLDRGKQPAHVIKIIAAVKELGYDVRLIFADFHSTDGDKVVFREELRNLASELKLTSKELTWLSRENKAWVAEAPRNVVNDIFSISNMFILPSKSETYSLVAQEAARFGNILMLNQDFPPLRSVYKEFPLYRRFSSTIISATDVEDMNEGATTTHYHPTEWAYWKDCAKALISRLETDRIAKQMQYIRQTKNLQKIFTQQLEPLINEEIE